MEVGGDGELRFSMDGRAAVAKVEEFLFVVRSSSQTTLTVSSDDDDDDEDPKLPHDVAVEVLKRLPVESLLRFRSVCRSWCSAIDDPRFVALHLSHSALDASIWYLVCLDRRNPAQNLFSLLSQECLTLPSWSRIEMPFAAPRDRYDFVGSCNGLICLKLYTENGCDPTMYLWNLFTRKHKVVRPSGLDSKFPSMEAALVALGFGFDSVDYKIVRIIYYPYHKIKRRVEIYSLSADSWRSLERELPTVIFSRPAVFLNGNLHWYTFEIDYLRLKGVRAPIVSFDIAGEVFNEMALPEELVPKDGFSLLVSLAALNDLLAVFVNLLDEALLPEPQSVCSVWVMREYGVPESWTKLYTFKACGVAAGFDGFTRNGDILMEMDTDTGERVSWNPTTGQYTNLPLSGKYDLVTIVGSLVSLNR